MENKALNKITANDIQELLVKLKDKSRTHLSIKKEELMLFLITKISVE